MTNNSPAAPTVSDQNTKSGLLLHRRSKLIGFLIVELSTVAVLIVVGTFAVSLKPADPTLAVLIDIVTIIAAVAVALIPIAFFGIAPILPRAR